MNKNSCIAFAGVSVNGKTETSRLHKDLMSKKGMGYSRPLANMIYATYITNDIASQMEAVKNADGSPKYRKNRQGQFNAKDVAEFMHIEDSIEEINNLTDESYRAGFTESLAGKKVEFSDAEEVLGKIVEFNNKHKGLVASIAPIHTDEGTKFFVKVNEKNAETLEEGRDAQERLKAWDIYKHVLSGAGVDLSDVPPELKNIFSAYNTDLVTNLKNLSKYEKDNIFKNTALALFFIDKDSPEIERLVKSFGSIENAAQAVDDINHGYGSEVTDAQKVLLSRAITHAQKMRGIDLEKLENQVGEVALSVAASSKEHSIAEEIDRLNKKYHIGVKENRDVNEKIKYLSDANRKAMVQLSRRIKELKRMEGNNEEGKALEKLYYSMDKELKNKHYYNGIIKYMELAGKDVAKIDSILKGIPEDGTEMEKAMKMAAAIQKIKAIKDQYLPIVSALASDKLGVDEFINQSDIDNIRANANELAQLLTKNDEALEELTELFMRKVLRAATNGKIKESEINDYIEKALKDVSWQDRMLYAFGTQSNLIIGAAGAIVQNQYLKRNDKLRLIRAMVDKADNDLKESGSSSEFMYEKDGNGWVVSDIDWYQYETERQRVHDSLVSKGFRGFKLKEAMEKWRMENTEERIVDKDSGRTERVPIYKKAVDFQQGWTPAQIKYYNTMLELKGQLETAYPNAARNLYWAPQVRRNTADALSEATGFNDVGKAIGNKVKDIYTVREDDTNYGSNGTVLSEDVSYAEGNYDNTIKKRIPIFYQRAVEKGELLKDFSSALMHEAASSTTYEAMDEIEDLLCTIRDFADSKAGAPNKNIVENIEENRFQHNVKYLYKWGKKNNVGTVLNSFMEVYLYGQRRDPNTPKWLNKLVDTTIKYTSFKGLATNVPGAMANALTGVQQIFIEAGCNEFFGGKDLLKASLQLFGKGGTGGDIMEILSNNKSHKSTLLWDFFDPSQDNYESDSSKRYHSSMFRKLVSKDLSFIGYGTGEFFIHLIPMYAILNHEKVKLNGETVSLYDVFDVSEKESGNAELTIKDGATYLDGSPVTFESLKNIRGRIRYANQSMHGAMNNEDKGLIHQYCLGRLAMNFRQWMVGHVARRFRGRHFDYALGDWREGYWTSLYKALFNDDTKETWKMGMKKDAVLMFMKDLLTFTFRSSSQWDNLSDMQKYNIKRVRAEILTLIVLCCLSAALGEPDEHKKKFWRRFFIYQTKRMILDTEGYMPIPQALGSVFTIMNSPMAGVSTLNSFLYCFNGLYNGDLGETIQSGNYKGWNKYLRNVTKYTLPFFKDYERLRTLDKDESLFKVFETSPSNH